MSKETEEEQSFCMIILGKEGGKFNIFPMLTDVCHCNKLETKHFQLYAKYNEDKTGIIPTNEEDLKAFELYCKDLKM